MKKINLLIISVVSLLVLFGVSLSFAANTDRNVYGVYTENYNGVHIYDEPATIPAEDVDGTKVYQWHGALDSSIKSEGAIEGNNYTSYEIVPTDWVVVAYTPITGYNDVSPRDMSAFVNGKISFFVRSSNVSFSSATVGFQYKNARGIDTPYGKQLWELGFVSNGEWQNLSITVPSGVDLTKVIALFLFQPRVLTVGDKIDIDNIRWIKSGAGSFDVKLKNVSGGVEVSTVTWSQDVFRNGWKASEQYLEFDLDKDTSKNWHIKIYTTNGVAGLKPSDGISPNLPMCWRVDKKAIPYDNGGTDKATFSIAQAGEEHNYGLYDSGVFATDPYYYPWFYFVDKEDSGFDDKTDYMTVWSYKGFHAADNGAYWGMPDMNANGKKIAPKLYFGADFSKAIAGSTGSPITYTSNIKVEFVNE